MQIIGVHFNQFIVNQGLQALQPARQKRYAQGVLRSDDDAVGRIGRAAQRLAHSVYLANRVPRKDEKALSRRAQGGGIGASIDEIDAEPVFQCPDTPAERGLGDIAGFSGLGKTAVFSQRDKVLQPLQFHFSRSTLAPLPFRCRCTAPALYWRI